MSTILQMASLTVPPLPVCGERIACRAEAQRRREVRGFDRSAKNPHPTLSLAKGEATEERTTRSFSLGSARALACTVRRLAERNVLIRNVSGEGAGNGTRGTCAPRI
jgi:hypothetical protein